MKILLSFVVVSLVGFSAHTAETLSIEYSNTFTGPSFAKPFSSRNYNDEERLQTGSIELENELVAGFLIKPDFMIGLATECTMSAADADEQIYELGDPKIVVRHASLYSSGNFNFEADLSLSAPTSPSSRHSGLATTVASEQVLTYEVPNSRWTLGFTTNLEKSLYENSGNREGNDWKVSYAPGAEYRFSDALSTNFSYETDYSKVRFTETEPAFDEGSRIEGGLIWKITRDLEFNPNIHTKTSRPLAWESMTFGAKLNWVLL